MTDLSALLAELRTSNDALAKSMPAATVDADAAAAAAAKAAAEAAEAERIAAEAAAAEAARIAAEAAAAEAARVAAEEAAAAEAARVAAAAETPVAKSMKVTDANGVERDAIDGLELIQALEADIALLRTELAAVVAPAAGAALAKSFHDHAAAVVANSGTMAKALAGAVEALGEARALTEQHAQALAAQAERLTAQDALIKSLGATIETIGAQGVGRRSVLDVADRQSQVGTPAASEKVQTVQAIFAKAQTLNQAGKLTGFDVSRIVANVNGGNGVPQDYAHLFAAS